MDKLETLIDSAWERRSELSPGKFDAQLRNAIECALDLLESGERRVAEPAGDGWQVNQWLKKAVLLY